MGEGRGRRIVGQQMLWWGLDCSCLFEKGVRRERRKPQEGMRQDKPELPDVFTAGDCEKWRDSWHIRKTLEKRSLHSLIFFIMLSSARLSSSTAKFFQFYFHLLMCEHPLGVLLIYTRLYAVVTELCVRVCVGERCETCQSVRAFIANRIERDIFKSSQSNAIALINPSYVLTCFSQ